jgi:hypothetical protein
VVICDRHQWVYVAAPKTATTTIHRWLIENECGRPFYDNAPPPAEARRRWLDRNGQAHDKQHARRIPNYARRYFTWSVVRDPLDRAESLYRHYLTDAIYAPHVGFVDFLGQVVGRSWPLDHFYTWNQADWLNLCRLDAVVDFADLPAGLHRMGVTLPAVALPRLNVATARDPLPWTPPARVAVTRWAAADLALLRT